MRAFRDAPIKQKLTLVMAVTSLAGLLLMGAAAVGYEVLRFRHETLLDLTGQAQIISAASATALASGDLALVRKVLSALSTQPEIVFGRIFGADGRLAAEYARTDVQNLGSNLPPQPEGPRLERGLICFSHPIFQDKQKLGTLMLCADLRELHARLKGGASILGVALLASLLLALVLGGRLQRMISGPILNLAELAQTVAAREDYSLRGAKHGEDEIGLLVDRFNDMLGQTQRNVTERKQLEKQILEISDREQARIGQDLHDGLCQMLVSIGLNLNALKGGLEDRGLPESAKADRIAGKLSGAIATARHVAQGLYPVNLESDGLAAALHQLAANTSADFGVPCTAECGEGVSPGGQTIAIHLYRIAQEAVHNAIKHASPTRILIRLGIEQDRGSLTIADDGTGISGSPKPGPGMGLEIMRYRAGMIGGTLEIRRGETGGTIVVCLFQPANAR
jgi:signal transduction histidine kinase